MLNGPTLFQKEDESLLILFFSSLWESLIWKISPLVISQLLGVFRNTLTANDKYRVRYCENLLSPIQMQLS